MTAGPDSILILDTHTKFLTTPDAMISEGFSDISADHSRHPANDHFDYPLPFLLGRYRIVFYSPI